MKRPLLWAGLLYVAGILVGNFVPVSLAILLPVSLAVATAAIAWANARLYLLYPLILLVAWTGYTLHTAIISPHDLRRVLGAAPASGRGDPDLPLRDLSQRPSPDRQRLVVEYVPARARP